MMPGMPPPSPNLLESFLDSPELLLPALQLGIRLLGLGLGLLQLAPPGLVLDPSLLDVRPLGRQLALHRLKFRRPILDRRSEGRDGFLMALSFGLGPTRSLLQGGLSFVQLLFPLCEGRLLLTEGRGRGLEFAGPRLTGRVSPVHLLLQLRFPSLNRRDSFPKLLLLTCERGFRLLDRRLSRRKFVNAAQEGRLVFLKASLQSLQGLGFLLDRPFPFLQLTDAALECGPFRRILPFHFVLAGLQIFGSRAGCLGPIDQSRFFRLHRLLALVERRLAFLRDGIALRQFLLASFDRSESLLERPFGAE